MDLTAFAKRTLLVTGAVTLLATLTSCATNRPANIDIEQPIGDSSVAMSEAPNQLPDIESARELPRLARTTVLLESGIESVGIELASGKDFDRLLIDAATVEGDYDVLRLSNPERLVIDLFNHRISTNKVLTTENAELINQLRIGAHPDKSRIVIDLKDDNAIEHNIKLAQGKILVTVAQPSEMELALNTLFPFEAASADPIMMASDANLDDARAAFEPEDQEQQVAAEPMKEAEVFTNDMPELQLAKPSASLNTIQIEEMASGNFGLVAETSGAVAYRLTKTAPSEYVLTLRDVSLDPQAATTILAPPASAGRAQIRSVRPVVQGSDVLLRIFSSPETELNALSRGNSIIVAARKAGMDEDQRAQANPEEAAAEAAAEPAPVVESELTDDTVDVDLSDLLTDAPKYTGRLISLDLQDTDIDNALRIIAEVSNLNIIASDDVSGKVTLRLIDVPWDQALDVILKTNGLDKVQEGSVIRIAPVEKLRLEREALKQAQEAEEELEPLQVRYVRVSYARAAELKPLVESVITERGTVAYDDRTNQLIVKDIGKGIRNVAQLVQKIDLRTPQVLLETQIVEAQRSIFRELGSELGFEMIRSPETGNATGYNFPNSVEVGGSVSPGNTVASSFPAAVSAAAGSAVDLLFDSADGSKSLDVRISSLEEEGRIRVVSRPSVATTNNKPA
ncbi:MAG: AMIN domain-containing protein, partial [Bdellovibrionales bacterium]|nr:AMIN domain-containing protein [Bdellovibrionales bacterium]